MGLLSILRKASSVLKLSPSPNSTCGDPLEQRGLLRDEMLRSEIPHLVNAMLNELEYNLGIDNLWSFPPNVTLCMTTVCNARCLFCHYIPKPKELRDYLTLDDFKKMSWLKYVTTLNLNAGYGDSLVSPYFGDIYDYLKSRLSHLNCTLVTNGIGLTEEICNKFVGHLSELVVSLNSPRAETWEKLVQSRGFDRIIKMVTLLEEKKKRRGTTKPTIAMSMILFRNNIHEVMDFLELSKKVDAQRVIFVHYYPFAFVGNKALPDSESLYYDKRTCDAVMEKAGVRARELNLELCKPQPFSLHDGEIFVGERVEDAPRECRLPWTNCFLSSLPGAQRQREMVFCCFGTFYKVTYKKNDLGEDAFMENVWNHPVAQYFRNTINGRGFNPVCSICNVLDRFDPKNKQYYEELYRAIDLAFSSPGCYLSPEEILRSLKTAMRNTKVMNLIE